MSQTIQCPRLRSCAISRIRLVDEVRPPCILSSKARRIHGKADKQGHQKVQAARDHFSEPPWEILEVSIDADEKTIKKAYRHLALRNHPDINASPDAPVKFHKISEAYEMLMDRKRGKDYVEQKSRRRHSDWSFHDWYWDFMLQQRQKSQGSQIKAKPILQEDHLHGQLAGLRRRAAGRRKKTPSAADHLGAQTSDLHEVHQKRTGVGKASYTYAHDQGIGSEGLQDDNASEHHEEPLLASQPSQTSSHAQAQNERHAKAHSQDHSANDGSGEERESIEDSTNRTEALEDEASISRQLQGLKRRAVKRRIT